MKTFMRNLALVSLIFLMVMSVPLSALAADTELIADTEYDELLVGDVAYIKLSDWTYQNGSGKAYKAAYKGEADNIRDFYFRPAGYGSNSTTINKNYDPNIQLYCLEKGEPLPEEGTYWTAYAPESSTAWAKLSDAGKIGVLLTLGFGYPASSPTKLGLADDVANIDDAIAATQVLVWEFSKGLRTDFTSTTAAAGTGYTDSTIYDGNDSKYYMDLGIDGTPAETAYWKILELAQDYYEDDRFDYYKLLNDNSFVVWQKTNYQSLVSYTLPDEEIPWPQYDTGTIEIYKTDLGGVPLAGAKFEATNIETGETFPIGPTDNNGYAVSADETPIPFGTYTIVETVKPEGFTDDGKTWTVVIDETAPNGVVRKDIKNRPNTGTVVFHKETNTGADLSGWEIKLYSDAACTKLVGTYTIGANGTASDTLVEGTYYAKETANGNAYWGCDTAVKTVTIQAKQTTNITFSNIHYGKIQITKKTNTSANLAGWEFKIYRDAALTDLVGTYITGANGTVTTENLLPMVYYIQETAIDDPYWSCSTTPKGIRVTAGQTAGVTITNTHYGKIQFNKETNTGADLSGWEIKLYSDAGLTNLVGTYITGEDGKVATENLLPGTYYAKETASGSEYWVSDAEVKAITVTAGHTASATFNNTHYGKIQITKKTNTGANLAGWEFKIYRDAALTDLVGTYITGADGTVTTENLLPMVYYIQETAIDDPYWSCSTTPKGIRIAAGQTASVTINNTHYGKIHFVVNTNTGADLSGWEIKLYTDAGLTNLVGTYVTGEDGKVATENLLPGTYYAKETASGSEYWVSDAEVKTITVTAGQTAGTTFNNIHHGKIHFVVNTNTGVDLSGWEIKLYTDAELTDLVGTYITGEDGTIATEILLPGTYYAQQTASQDPFWSCDTEVKTAIVIAGQATEVVFNNTHYGNIRFDKTTNTGADLSGWEIKLYSDAGLTDLIGTYITGEDGTIITENLLPGTYYAVETPSELIYWSSDAETKEITVTAGDTQEVNFHNDLLSTTITIDKVSPEGAKLAGAKFLLEWSVDGTNWTPVIFTDSNIPTIGCCTSADLANGCLISSKDASISFTGLYPTLIYRVTEVTAPKGYLMLTDFAYNGALPADSLELTLTVVNNPEFPLPATGVTGSIAPFIGAALAVLTTAALAVMIPDKSKKH